METSKIEFTRVNNDVNGNPRYVCHFLNLITDRDEQEIKTDFAATLARDPFKFTGLKYEHALYKAKKIGGRKFHNKQYGGGIVFQSYNIHDTENQILNLINNNIMEANFTTVSNVGINRNHRKENHYTGEYMIMAIDEKTGEISQKISCRMYSTNAMSYCCIWVSVPGAMTSGSGSAGGYGYHRASAAVNEAITRAGFKLSESIAGVGDSAIKDALLAMARELKYNKPQLFNCHA